MSDNWLTVSQAALQLGISERQARRYAGRLAPEDREDAPDMEPDAALTRDGHDSTIRPARRPARVRLEAMQRARDGATKRENPQIAPAKEPDAPLQDAGRSAGQEPDSITKGPDTTPVISPALASGAPLDWQERAAEYKGQIDFLRGVVEQHQRSEAELRAALREALRAQPRQLTGGGDAPVETPVTAPQIAPVAAPVVLPIAQAKAPTPTRQAQKQRAVRELLRAFLGIGGSKDRE